MSVPLIILLCVGLFLGLRACRPSAPALKKTFERKDPRADLPKMLPVEGPSTAAVSVDTAAVPALSLLEAVQRKDVESARRLLAAGGADVNQRADAYLPDGVLDKNETPLLLASWFGPTEMVRLLLDYYPDVNAVGRRGTPLTRCAQRGDLESVQLLLSRGANVNWASESGYTPLITAAVFGHKEVVEELLRWNANVHAEMLSDGVETALVFAARQDKENVIPPLIRAGADVNVQDYQGYSALMWAARRGRTELIKTLLDAGAKTDLRNKDNQTALGVAMAYGQSGATEVLRQRGAP